MEYHIWECFISNHFVTANLLIATPTKRCNGANTTQWIAIVIHCSNISNCCTYFTWRKRFFVFFSLHLGSLLYPYISYIWKLITSQNLSCRYIELSRIWMWSQNCFICTIRADALAAKIDLWTSCNSNSTLVSFTVSVSVYSWFSVSSGQ